MIAKLAKSTAHFFVFKNVIDKENEAVYSYGLELLYSSFINILLAIVMGILTDQLLPITMFMAAFIIIRQYIGGYHSNTHLGCISILAIVLITFVVVVKYITINHEVSITIISIVLSSCATYMFAPVEHPNKPLSNEDKIRLRKRGVISILLVSILIILLLFWTLTRRYALYISLGMLTASTAMVCEIIIHKRKCDEYET